MTIAEPQAISLLGTPLYAPTPVADKAMNNYREAREKWSSDPQNVENWIWYGRRTAYTGAFQEAITIYTEALTRFPEEARLYRHRGHRYISLRKFDMAIEDFKQAAKLVEGKPDELEPDGQPNARNLPVSTLQGNIYYHLGLAYYLKDEMSLALEAYQRSFDLSQNDDMRVASQYWLYMILGRLGREDEAKRLLEPLAENLDIIENMAYYKLCLFFKGVLTKEELNQNNEGLVDYMNDALGYGLGNWYWVKGMKEEARNQWKYVIENSTWAGFAAIAAEADYVRYFSNKENGG